MTSQTNGGKETSYLSILDWLQAKSNRFPKCIPTSFVTFKSLARMHVFLFSNVFGTFQIYQVQVLSSLFPFFNCRYIPKSTRARKNLFDILFTGQCISKSKKSGAVYLTSFLIVGIFPNSPDSGKVFVASLLVFWYITKPARFIFFHIRHILKCIRRDRRSGTALPFTVFLAIQYCRQLSNTQFKEFDTTIYPRYCKNSSFW